MVAAAEDVYSFAIALLTVEYTELSVLFAQGLVCNDHSVSDIQTSHEVVRLALLCNETVMDDLLLSSGSLVWVFAYEYHV